MPFKKKPVDVEALDAAVRQAQDFAEPSEGEKYCTTCGTKKPLTDFHKDDTREDGHRNICAGCRTVTNKRHKTSTLKSALEKMEGESLEKLNGMASEGGSYDPHINEVFESMLRPFGGVSGWSKHLFATYLASPPGSQKRVRIHEMMVNMATKVTKLNLAERQLDMMEDKDLIKVMQTHLHEYQDSKNLPGNVIPTLSGDVIELQPEEVKVKDDQDQAVE